jgi:translation initiation factor 4A
MDQVNENINEPNIKTVTSFEDMGLRDKLLRGIYAYGFEYPSSIQQKGIMPIIENNDVIEQAQSGMGKTATFCIGSLQLVDDRVNKTQAIILAHTRELAFQIDAVIRSIGRYTKTRYCLSVKGVPISDNIAMLKKNPTIVIGTPGRIYDMICKKALRTNGLRILVIDEADEMLSKGFQEQIYNIFQTLPKEIQVALFSATMPPDFFDLAENFMRNPVKILVKKEQLTLEGIKQYYINVEKNEHKFDVLRDLYNFLTINQSIVYCNSRRMVEDLYYKLTEENFPVSFIHGDMTPAEREQAMFNFRNAKTRVLISTDLLSRGIDIQQVSIVINYDIPNNVDSYLHRIGRSGRYGRKGISINFATYYDKKKIRDIEEHYCIEIDEMPDDLGCLL